MQQAALDALVPGQGFLNGGYLLGAQRELTGRLISSMIASVGLNFVKVFSCSRLF